VARGVHERSAIIEMAFPLAACRPRRAIHAGEVTSDGSLDDRHHRQLAAAMT